MFTNNGFYVIWAIFAFFPLALAVLIPETAKKKFIVCLCVLAVTFGFTVIRYMNDESINNRWNGGICNCGGTYEFSAASRYCASRTFYYSCDVCGHTEEFSQLMK